MDYPSPQASAPAKALLIAGHDPSGGAGIGADIATACACGVHPLPLATCQTIQDGRDFSGAIPSRADTLERQFRLLCRQFSPDVIKLGLLPDKSIIESLGALLREFPDIPVVCDPVSHSGNSGSPMASADAAEALKDNIFGRCQLLVPNRSEALGLSGKAEVEEAAAALIESGCANVLVTSAFVEGDSLVHLLRRRGRKASESLEQARRPEQCHGTGCAHSTAIACHLARGEGLTDAIHKANAFLDRCIRDSWPAHPGVNFLRWRA